MKNEDVDRIFSKRHSCRNFSSESVNLKDIGCITKAGLLAPCGMGKHASHLFVFKKGEAGYDKLEKIMLEKTNRDPFYQAPVIIVECIDSNSIEPIRDGSAVIENMLLAASMLNLGACWIHAPSVVLNADKTLLKKVEIPEEYTVVDAVALGHPDK